MWDNVCLCVYVYATNQSIYLSTKTKYGQIYSRLSTASMKIVIIFIINYS